MENIIIMSCVFADVKSISVLFTETKKTSPVSLLRSRAK